MFHFDHERIPERVPVGRMVLDRMPANFFFETEQVAFMTQNIVPGIDFSNDPLLQGRNFSYLDTQLKRLGGPNFTHLPINAPKCPVHHFQQDGHMAMQNPVGRANYEPNSWGAEIGGPRETANGVHSMPVEPDGPKVRLRPESFADHYSQARQFFISQSPIEQQHIGDALVFELSKVEVPAIRERVVGQLRNIDADLAQTVADELGLKKLRKAASAAVPTRRDLPVSDALSILKNPPGTFVGRKLGILITDGVDAKLLAALEDAIVAEGAVAERIAPMVGGVTASDGSLVEAHHKIDGGPSVLFDAVAILAGDEGILGLLKLPPARDFVSDAYAHYKFVGFSQAAVKLFQKVGLPDDLDDGFAALDAPKDIKPFIASLYDLRFWDRRDAA